jgi:hypothetical protein
LTACFTRLISATSPHNIANVFYNPFRIPSELAGQRQNQFHFTELNSQLAFVKKSPLPPFFKGGNKKSPFVKGDLEGFLICST